MFSEKYALTDTTRQEGGEKSGSRAYIQVAYMLGDESTAEREFTPLLAIKDNYPKFVITMDKLDFGQRQGVRHITLRKFLLKKDLI